MRKLAPAAFAVALVLTDPVGAAEFVPGWGLEGVWSSNVFRTPDKDSFDETIPKEDDFSLRTGPDVRVREEQGDFTYDASYRLRYEEFARLNGISTFDHYARANGEWSYTDRTAFFGSNDFAYTESLSGLFETFGADVSPVVSPVRQRVTTNLASGGVRHRLGPLWELTLSADHQFYDYGSDAGDQSTAFSGTAQLTRGITPRLVLGFGGQASRQESTSDVVDDDTGTTFAQVFATGNYSLTPTWRVSFSAGPALSMPDEVETEFVSFGAVPVVDVSSCPRREDGIFYMPGAQAAGGLSSRANCTRRFAATFDAGDVPFNGESGFEDSLTYFARIQTEKQWRTLRGSVGYSRSATNASGLGTSTLLDTFTSLLTWAPSLKWSVTLSGTYSIQSAVSEAREQLVALAPVNAAGRPCNPALQLCFGFPFEVTSGDKIDNPIDIRTTRIELRAERRFSRNLVGTALASWYEQTNSGAFADNTRTEYRFVVGVTWKFDPIPIPL